MICLVHTNMLPFYVLDIQSHLESSQNHNPKLRIFVYNKKVILIYKTEEWIFYSEVKLKLAILRLKINKRNDILN